jgi:hypothetical protein
MEPTSASFSKLFRMTLYTCGSCALSALQHSSCDQDTAPYMSCLEKGELLGLLCGKVDNLLRHDDIRAEDVAHGYSVAKQTQVQGRR